MWCVKTSHVCVWLMMTLLWGCGATDLNTGFVYTVRDDDTLKSLAQVHYGDSGMWPAIWLGTNTKARELAELDILVDPARLRAGNTIWIPGTGDATSLLSDWTSPGTFVKTRCWDATRDYGTVTCGYLVVPADHDGSETGATLQIAVAVVASRAAQPAEDPVFLLAGGPGVSGVLTLYLDRILQFSESRDVVLIDQRGMGHSQPGLFCKDDESTADCRERLVSSGVDLSHFHTTAIADDIELLRRVMGLEQINLFGFSYGTFLAQEILRRHPGGIRCAILDSCLPVSVATTAEGGPGAVASFLNLVADYAADDASDGSLPDLEDAFYAVLDQADAEPFAVTIHGTTLSVGPAMLVTSLLMSLNSPEQAPYVPAAIRALQTGDTGSRALAMVLASNSDNREYLDSQGAKISVKCHDILPFETYTDAEQQSQSLNTHVANHYNLFARTGHEQCAIWQIPAAGAGFHEPAESDVPTLILGGKYDTLTRWEWGQTVADTLSNVYFFPVPKTGHVTIQRDCPLDMAKAFLVDPSVAPDAACLAEMDSAPFFREL